MIKLWNPTNEKLSGRFSGIDYTLLPGNGTTEVEGCTLEVEDGCGNHLLNHLGPRGLTSLKHGDREENKAKDSIAANKAFKRKIVTEYNTRNEQRKHIGLEFLEPTPEVISYAKELGLELVETYAVKAQKAADNSELVKTVADLTSLVSELMTKVASLESGKGKK